MEDGESESLPPLTDKKAILLRFWTKTVKKYFEEKVCLIDQPDIPNP